MCSGLNQYRAERLRDNELRQLRTADQFDGGDSRPGSRIYCMACGKTVGQCLCSKSERIERMVK